MNTAFSARGQGLDLVPAIPGRMLDINGRF